MPVRRVPGLKAKVVNLCFCRGAVQPLKSMVAGRTIKPKNLLQIRLELQFKRDRAPANVFARSCKFPCTSLHGFQRVSHHAPILRLPRNVPLVGAGGEIALGLSPLR